MGLDTTHGCWNGPYSAFHRFREDLAKAAGIPLDMMQGYYAPDDQYVMYQPPESFRVDEYETRPDWQAKVKSEADIIRRYIHPYIDRDGTVHNNEYIEVPHPYVDPVALDGISVGAMEWLRPRGPDGPLCNSHYGPGVYRWVLSMAQWLPLSWDLFASDPIVILLHHSDCDGDIRGVRNQKRLADRLERLAETFAPEHGRHPKYDAMVAERGEESMARGLYDGTRAAALRFAAGLRLAASERKPVLFR